MADGSGTPEQLKMTYNRFNRFLPENNILVITLDRFAKTAREVLPTLPQENLLVEPVGRKTAPCMAFACYTLLSRDPEAVVVATPWDLYIRDEALFAQTISDAFEYVEKNDVLMTLGIVPKTPDVNFGYIQVKEGRNAHLMAGPLQVKTFTEKPSICTEMEKYLPEVTELFRGWETQITDRAFIEQAYAECPKVSLDYGVMEHTDRAWLYPARFGWADIERL